MEYTMICIICGQNKTRNNVTKKCQQCIEFWSKRLPGFTKAWAATTIKDAKRRYSTNFSIDTNYLYSILPKDGKCTILKKDFELPHNGKAGPYSATIDRIQPELGYIKGNVRIISKLANEMLSIANNEELKLFANWITTSIR
jgi:hypothetical protein